VPKKSATESGSGSKARSVSSTETKHAVDVLFSMHGNALITVSSFKMTLFARLNWLFSPMMVNRPCSAALTLTECCDLPGLACDCRLYVDILKIIKQEKLNRGR